MEVTKMAKKFLFIAFCLTLVCMLASCDIINFHTHNYDEWQTVKTATCTENGINERYCECGDRQTQTIYALEHQYDEWVITEESTCTKIGSKERYCECGDKQIQSISAIGHQYGEWVVSNEATCIQSGEQYALCSLCNDRKTDVIPISEAHAYDDGVITKEPTCTEKGSKTAICTVCNKSGSISVPSLGHAVDNNGVCTRCGRVTLNMTSDEIYYSQQVRSMKRSCSEGSSGINIFIRLQTSVDGISYVVSAPAYVDVKIVDENGTTLYSKTLIKTSTQENISISYDELPNAPTGKGVCYYTVYNDYFSFVEESQQLNNLPWALDIELPELPHTASTIYSNKIDSSCTITDITYKVNGNDITFYLAGEKTYDSDGNTSSSSFRIYWKLYDSDGYVVADGNVSTNSITVGEKFRDLTIKVNDVAEQGETYRLVIINNN